LKLKEIYILVPSIFVFLFVIMGGNLNSAEGFIIAFQVYLFLRFINNIGYTICFFDFLCFYSVLDTLLMPLIGYRIFNPSNPMVRLWGWFMRVPEDDYYGFMIPANLALFFGVNLLTRKIKSEEFKARLALLKVYCKDKASLGIAFTAVGIISSTIDQYVPDALSFVFYLTSMLKYVGPLYIYFSDSPIRKRALAISIVFFLLGSVARGFFGEFMMYSVLAGILITLQYNIKFLPKLLVFLFGIFLVFILQSVKGTYRDITWMGKSREGLSVENSSHLEIFGTLFYRRALDLRVFDEKNTFYTYTRFNQGYLVSRAMDYVPRVEDFAYGETIARTLGAVALPRFIWPDKPEAGGHENLARFLGLKKKLTYSMNIGPYGEAYGNFGPVWGVPFIFLYGVLLSYTMYFIYKKSLKRPTWILWTPLLFFYTLTVETDILSTLNSFFKAYIFAEILFWYAKKFHHVIL
jgi:hypothetical protein